MKSTLSGRRLPGHTILYGTEKIPDTITIPLQHYLRDYYDVAKNLDSPISRELSGLGDILNGEKHPLRQYNEEEIDAILRICQERPEGFS